MKKLLLITMLFTACKPAIKTVTKDNITYTYNPNVWSVVELTKEDSLKLDSLIKLNH